MNKLTPVVVAMLFVSSFLQAQNTIAPDELFKSARKAAFEDKNYNKAKEFAYQALAQSPSYADIDIFLGRVYSWNGEYDSARFHFTKVLTTNPGNEDASVAYADLEYWNGHYDNALTICNLALALDPASEELLFRKAKILNATKHFREASTITGYLLKKNKNNSAALALASTIKDALSVNKLSIGYDHTSFDKQYSQPWDLLSISYARQTKRGSIILRMNYANRFGANGIQGEVDAYPRINKTFYSYLNLGYSGNVGVFPKFRAGFSLYANLPHSFEAEVGMRYLYFTGATNIYTASIGKYYKNFLFIARTYITPSGGSVSQTYTIAAHYYFKTADDYIALTIGTGISPDDNNQNIQFNSKQIQLSSKKISASFNHTFLKWNVFSIGAGIINQEYLPKIKGNQLDVSVGLSRRF